MSAPEGQVPVNAAEPGAEAVAARYPGTCAITGEAFAPGAEIIKVAQGWGLTVNLGKPVTKLPRRVYLATPVGSAARPATTARSVMSVASSTKSELTQSSVTRQRLPRATAAWWHGLTVDARSEIVQRAREQRMSHEAERGKASSGPMCRPGEQQGQGGSE
ncbi:hypothetical protein [Deinococcus maricopensis]|uniref:Uncharacterized protein n=1 Tax=Deinococcus maricopensis (strain DSM 21211 / LMG 22137 / NRRL B-23946 / LB-34) TaxID=709986 RepID=E8U617_DEIML|nr:hypothetical protein [Deinococcus maricopensis]ADV66506.1 hypothetical protein Deima_0851 [Deinococcus maricopensis DSM 21211]